MDFLPVLRAYAFIQTASHFAGTSYTMFSPLLLALSLFTACLAQETCPELPDTGIEIGQPVPIKPEDIPQGCSNFEILVGTIYLTYTENTTSSDTQCSSGD